MLLYEAEYFSLFFFCCAVQDYWQISLTLEIHSLVTQCVLRQAQQRLLWETVE